MCPCPNWASGRRRPSVGTSPTWSTSDFANGNSAILDRLTRVGITETFPEQAEFRAPLGKFYHRPPGGESWADVALRLRSFVDTISRECRGERILIVSHQVVVLMFRYILEKLGEADILDIDRAGELANCSVTSYELETGSGGHGHLDLRLYNHVAPIEDEGTEVTAEPDVPGAPRVLEGRRTDAR